MTLLPVGTNVHVRARDHEPFHLSDGVSTVATTVLTHTLRRDSRSLRLVFANRINDHGHDLPGPDPIEVRSAVVLPGAAPLALRFDGLHALSLAPGEVAISDPVDVDLPGGSAVATRTVVRVRPGERYPLGPETDASAGEGVSRSDGPGPVPPSTAYGYGPWQILGDVATDEPVVLVTGDSNAAGFGDVRGSAGHLGWVRRALDADLPYLNLAISGATALGTQAEEAVRARRALLRWVRPTLAVSALGTNDMRGGGPAMPEMRRRLLSHWQELADAGLPVVAATLPPVTTSTDGWASTAGQVPEPGHERRLELNAWIRSRPAPLAGVIDLAAAVTAAGASALWAPGTTDDGLHYGAAGHAAAAEAAEPVLRTLVRV